MALEHVLLLDHGGIDAEQRPQGMPEVATSGNQTGPFFLGEAFAPVPAKLVKKIQALEFGYGRFAARQHRDASVGGGLVFGRGSDGGGKKGTAGGATAHVGAMLHHIHCNRGRKAPE